MARVRCIAGVVTFGTDVRISTSQGGLNANPRALLAHLKTFVSNGFRGQRGTLPSDQCYLDSEVRKHSQQPLMANFGIKEQLKMWFF